MSPSTTTSSGIDWVVFDLGGVVLTETAALPALARRIGAPQRDFVSAYYAHRRDYDLHSDPARYWPAVAADCGAVRPDGALIAQLTHRDNRGWLGADPGMLALIDELRPAARLAVLSNAPSSMGDAVRSQRWATAFEHILISGDLGVTKPDAAIYTALLRTVGASADRVVFVDDKADNVAAAAALGIHAIRFGGAGRLRDSLVGLGLPIRIPSP